MFTHTICNPIISQCTLLNCLAQGLRSYDGWKVSRISPIRWQALGYTNVVHDGKLLIALDPEDTQKDRTFFEWYVSGNYHLLDISKKTYQEGLIYQKTGHKIPKSVVHNILKSPMYCREFLWNGKSYAETHEPVVSKELFDRV